MSVQENVTVTGSSSSSSSTRPSLFSAQSRLTASQRSLLEYFCDSNEVLYGPHESAETLSYYETLTAGQPVRVCYLDERRGKALVADRDVEEGEVLLVDVPLLSMRDFQSEELILLCDNCYAPIGSAADQARHILRRDLTTPEEALFEKTRKDEGSVGIRLKDAIPCPECTKTLYCSPRCLQRGRDTHLHASPLLDELLSHASQTNEVFLLVLRFYALISSPALSSVPLRTALRPFRRVAKTAWWHVLQPRESDPDHVPPHEFEASLRVVIEDALGIVRSVLGEERRERIEDILNADFYAQVVGMFEMNNLGVDVAGPIVKALEGAMEDEEEGDEDDEAKKVVDEIWKRVTSFEEDDESSDGDHEHEHEHGHDHEHDEEDQPYEGVDEKEEDEDVQDERPTHLLHADITLLLPLHSTINHSCNPNATIEYRDNRTTVIATRSIKAGEPVTTDYVQDDEPEERLDNLRKWGADMCDGSCGVCGVSA
ncbi:hypothetical protein HKX48_005110 [Thoreauomyces humboldtii]|nr:hypothetical protein HKX48_005110 [Thoreauomyces humboldtii]